MKRKIGISLFNADVRDLHIDYVLPVFKKMLEQGDICDEYLIYSKSHLVVILHSIASGIYKAQNIGKPIPYNKEAYYIAFDSEVEKHINELECDNNKRDDFFIIDFNLPEDGQIYSV